VDAVDLYFEFWQLEQAFKAIEPQYRVLKDYFRKAARDRSIEFPNKKNNFAVYVEQRPDCVCRVVKPEHMKDVIKWSGADFFDMGPDEGGLFTCHPSKGSEHSFELNVLKCRPKSDATSLLGRLTEKATAFVRGLRRG
jgi:hypothetical protein